jgi:hypothetical protein
MALPDVPPEIDAEYNLVHVRHTSRLHRQYGPDFPQAMQG